MPEEQSKHFQTKEDIGEEEFYSLCTFCLGRDGKADGALLESHKRRTEDLFVLATKNHGVLPITKSNFLALKVKIFLCTAAVKCLSVSVKFGCKMPRVTVKHAVGTTLNHWYAQAS